MKLRICALLALSVLMLGTLPGRAAAIEAEDHDAFFLALGTANISVRDSDALLSGSAFWGGIRIGLLSFLFVELGFGTVRYSDTVDRTDPVTMTTTQQNIKFRTTGANFGLGLVVPIRNLRLGARFQRHPNNRWAEDITDANTGSTISNRSGKINFDSITVFGQFIEGKLEVGMRRDIIRETDSVLENSFGVYLMWNIKI